MKFRLILDRARPAAENMAIDEALMQAQKKPESVPTLRFYAWERPSVTIGYFQDIEAVQKRFKNIPVVKRPTGGGLVLHGNDLTFSLSIKTPNSFLPGDVKASYLKINEVLIDGLRELFPGLDFADCKSLPKAGQKGERICFEQPCCYDLMLDGKKVAGSSQRRQAGTLLHQSTLFLKGEREALIRNIIEAFERKWGIEFYEGLESPRARALANSFF